MRCHGYGNLVKIAMGTFSQMSVIKHSKILELAWFCNNFYCELLATPPPLLTKLVVIENEEKHVIGLLRPEIEKRLVESEYFRRKGGVVEFEAKGGVEGRSKVFEELLRNWRGVAEGGAEELISLRGWRGENFEVKPHSGYSKDTLTTPLFTIERSATPLFGMRQYGVDINGYVVHPERGVLIWMQTRARNKQTWPGAVDNMVGGGLSTTFSVLETAIKEAQEEASIPIKYLDKLVPAGTVSFFFTSPRGLFPNTEFVYDLLLPLDFIPICGDGEVESFQLVDVKEALELLTSPNFKTTSAPVTIDFLVRHGLLHVGNEPHLPELLPLLHLPLSQYFS